MSMHRQIAQMMRAPSGGGSFLLDDYPGAIFAVSLRQLTSAGGNVARLFRHGSTEEMDFTAEEITDGTLDAWAGADTILLAIWYDQSGNGNDLSFPSGKPGVFVGGALHTINGLPAPRFNAATGTAPFTTATGLAATVHIVHKFDAGTANKAFFDGIIGEANNDSMWVPTTSDAVRLYGEYTSLYNYNLKQWLTQISSYSHAGGVGKYQLDEVLEQGAYPVHSIAGVTVGSSGTGALGFSGHLGDCIVYDGASAENFLPVHDRINSDYGIY